MDRYLRGISQPQAVLVDSVLFDANMFVRGGSIGDRVPAAVQAGDYRFSCSGLWFIVDDSQWFARICFIRIYGLSYLSGDERDDDYRVLREDALARF